jgi:sulfur carrier protein ThiS
MSSDDIDNERDFMKVSVKIFSVLREHVPDYNPQKGVDTVLTDGATVSDLLNHLGIPISEAPVVTCNGCVLHHGDTIQKDSIIEIFQSVAGG